MKLNYQTESELNPVEFVDVLRRSTLAERRPLDVILLSAPKAASYYPHIGMTKHESCWIVPRQTGGNA